MQSINGATLPTVEIVRTARCLLFLTAIAVFSYGCGGSKVLSSTEAKHLLLQLPYHYRWRPVKLPDGASGAVAGTAFGKHHTIVHFGISLGANPQPVPVPRVGPSAQDYEGGSGFLINDDLEVSGKNGAMHFGNQFHTAAQWQEGANIVVGMAEKFCKATTGKPCPPW